LVSLSGAVEDARWGKTPPWRLRSQILRNPITGRVPRRDAQRRTLAEIGTTSSTHTVADVASIVQPTSFGRGIARVARSHAAVASPAHHSGVASHVWRAAMPLWRHLPIVSTRFMADASSVQHGR
jgi:hypothetical protein